MPVQRNVRKKAKGSTSGLSVAAIKVFRAWGQQGGKVGGSIGGKARWEGVPAAARTRHAKRAAAARWKKKAT
jgi:hypothetical protein